MIKCTDPDQWAAVPGYEASEEDVARYFTHVRQCAFHAAIEQREEEQLRIVTALARSAPGSQSWELQEQNTATIRGGLDALEVVRRHVLIQTLSIRVNGAERVRLNLIEESCVTLELEAGALIGVWQPDQSGKAEDLYLTSYVLSAHRAASGEKSVSATVLEGGQRISFAVEPGGESRTQITVAYAETRVLPALRLSFARLKHRLAYRARELRWNSPLSLTAALLALLAALVLLPLLWSRSEESTQIANREGVPQSGGMPLQMESPVPSPSVPPTPNLNGETPTAPSQKVPTRAPPPVEDARAQISLAAVRRIYVGTEEGEDNQRLRAALIAQLQGSGKFTVVTIEQEADAVLLSEPTRGARVRVTLVNRAGKPLWFTTQPTAGKSLSDIDDVAGRIVKALSDEAQKRTRSGLTPRP